MTGSSSEGEGVAVDIRKPGRAGSPLSGSRFPVLDSSQLEALRRCGVEQEVGAGDVLFAEGDETYDLFVVLEGEMQIALTVASPKKKSPPSMDLFNSWARWACSPVSAFRWPG